MDSSGIRFHLTPRLRRYDASIMELGLEYNNRMAVPPGMERFSLTGTCGPQCTAVGLPREGIVIFGSQLHTHGAGVRVATTRVRGGREEVVDRDDHYSTHFQQIRRLREQVRVRPGDALVTTCR